MSKIPAPTKEVKVVPQDLRDKWGSICAIATACNMLDKGHYLHQYATAVRNSIAFLAKLHENALEDALKHPQAFMLSELKELKKNIDTAKKEANGSETQVIANSVDPASDGSEIVHPTPSPGGGSEAHP